MGRTDVRARRHRGHIGGDREDEPGGSGARPRRCDEYGHGRPGRDQPGDDRARGIHEPARRPQREDDQRRPGEIRAFQRGNHVLRGDGVDDAVNLRGEDNRAGGGGIM